MRSNIPMTPSQKKAFSRALNIYEETVDISRKLRKDTFSSREAHLERFNQAFEKYTELLDIMKELIRSADGDLKMFLRTKYDCFNDDYRILKADTNDLLKHNQDTFQLRVGHQEKILTDMIEEVIKYEKANIKLIADQKEKNTIKFFKQLGLKYLSAFKFIDSIFFTSEKNEDFSFCLSPFIKIPWYIMTIINKKEKKELKYFADGYQDIYKVVHKFNQVQNKSGLTASGNNHNFFLAFADCVKRLASFTKKNNSLENEARRQKVMADISQIDSSVIDFISKVFKSNPEIEYRPLNKNRSLLTIRSMVAEIITSIESIVQNLEFIYQDVHQLAFFFKFLKKYVLSYIIMEIYKRMITYSNIRKKIINIKV